MEKDQVDRKVKEQESELSKYIEMLEKGTVKDFQGVLKKIDDQKMRRRVMQYIQENLKTKKTEKKDILSMNMED